MKAARLLGLVHVNVRRDLRSAVASALGVALGTGSLVFFLALGQGLAAAVGSVFPTSSREVEAVVPQSALGGLLGDELKIDDALVERLSRLPGVERAFPKMALRSPAVARHAGSFFGKELRMAIEIVGVGVPPELVQEDLKRPFGWTDLPPGDVSDPLKRPLPVVVSRRLLEIYNKVFAPQRQLPRLTEGMIVGFSVPLDLGRSWVAARNMPEQIETSIQLVGFSERATLAGITLPMETVRRIHRRFHLDADTYTSVLVRVRSTGEISEVAERVKALGLELDEGERGRALQIGAAVRLASLALALLSALITGLAAVNVAQAFAARVRERRREIGVLRAVGATQGDVRALFLGEAAAVGLAGGAGGVSAGLALGWLCDHLARTRLPDFPFKPEHFFGFEGWMIAAGLALALASALLGAWVPARAAAALDPARALGEG